MRKDDTGLYQNNPVDFSNKNSGQYIYSDFFQAMPFPAEYPAFIQIHTEFPAQSVPLHWHLGPEIIYSRNQHLTLMVDGERICIAPGECALISSDALHSIEPENTHPGQDVMSISYNGSYIWRIYPAMRSQHICYLTGTSEDRQQLNQLCEDMHQIIEQPEVDYLRLNYLLFGMLILIYSKFVKEPPASAQARDLDKSLNRIRDILLYIKEHCEENITTSSVAAEFGYSREHFSRLFKRYADMSLKQYLNEYRLVRAADDLFTTDKRMLEVAMDNGFPDEKSFYGAFKRKYGVTPAEYRRQKHRAT